MKTPYNVLIMSSVSPDANTESTSPLTGGRNNDPVMQLSPFKSLFQFCKTSLIRKDNRP